MVSGGVQSVTGTPPVDCTTTGSTVNCSAPGVALLSGAPFTGQVSVSPTATGNAFNATADGDFTNVVSHAAVEGFVNGGDLSMDRSTGEFNYTQGGVAGVVQVSSNFANITGGSSTSSTITVNVASLPAMLQIIGTPFSIVGASPSGFNTASSTVQSYTPTSVTFASTANPGIWTSGGVIQDIAPTVSEADGVIGMVQNEANGPTVTGSPAPMGGYFQVTQLGSNGTAWGINTVGIIGNYALGIPSNNTVLQNEIDFDIINGTGNTVTGWAINAPYWNYAPATSYGIAVSAPGCGTPDFTAYPNTGCPQWTTPFRSNTGASIYALQASEQGTVSTSPSQYVLFAAKNGGIESNAAINEDINGNIVLTPSTGMSVIAPEVTVISPEVASYFQGGNGGYTAVRFSGDLGADVGAMTTYSGNILIGSENPTHSGSNGEISINVSTHALTFDGQTSAAAGSTDYSTASSAQEAHVLADGTGATSADTPNTVPARDASGNFAAGTITAALNGTATNATAVNGSPIPVSATGVSTNGSGQFTPQTGVEAASQIAGVAIAPSTVAIGGDSAISAGPRAFLPFSTGQLTAIVTGGQYFVGKLAKAGTIESFTATGATFTCATNPTLTLEDCGTTAGTCATPTALASVTLTAANTSVDGTITTPTLSAGHYFEVETTAGVCTALNATGSAEYKMQ